MCRQGTSLKWKWSDTKSGVVEPVWASVVVPHGEGADNSNSHVPPLHRACECAPLFLVFKHNCHKPGSIAVSCHSYRLTTCWRNATTRQPTVERVSTQHKAGLENPHQFLKLRTLPCAWCDRSPDSQQQRIAAFEHRHQITQLFPFNLQPRFNLLSIIALC